MPTLRAPARVGFNEEAMAHVGCPVRGRAIELKVRLGDDVQRGAELIVIESPELASQIVRRFEQFSAGANSYAVRNEDGVLQWRANVDGREVAWLVEPETTTQQRLRIDLLSILPLDSLL